MSQVWVTHYQPSTVHGSPCQQVNASLGKALPASWWRDTDLNRRKRGREEGTELSQVVGGTSLFFTLALQKQGLAQGCLQAPPPQTLSPVSWGERGVCNPLLASSQDLSLAAPLPGVSSLQDTSSEQCTRSP